MRFDECWEEQNCGYETPCHVWASDDSGARGYGRFYSSDLGSILAHRMAFLLRHGYVPELPLMVLHKCNVKRCVNADHLYEGSYSENIRDAWRAGARQPRSGEKAPHAKLTDAEVAAILASRRSHVDLALCYGVSRTWIYELRRRGGRSRKNAVS